MNSKKILAGLLSALTFLGSKASGHPGSTKIGRPDDMKLSDKRNANIIPSGNKNVVESSVKPIRGGSSSKKKATKKSRKFDSVPEFLGEAIKKRSSKKRYSSEEKPKNNGKPEINETVKSRNLEKKYNTIIKSMEKDHDLQSLMNSGLSIDVFLNNLKYILTIPALTGGGFVGLQKLIGFLNGPLTNYECKFMGNIDVDMSPVVSLGKQVSLGDFVECWLKCWKEYNVKAKANKGSTIGELACQDGDKSEKELGKSFDDALSKDDWKKAMEIYSKCSSLKWLIMPTVPTGSMFGPMYVYLADNDNEGYKNWDTLLDNKELKVYDVSKYILADMIQAFTDYLVLSLDDRKKEEKINQLLLRIYRFFVVYFHLDIKGISPLGFGLVNGKHLGIDINENGNVVFNNDKIKTYDVFGNSLWHVGKHLLGYDIGESGKIVLNDGKIKSKSLILNVTKSLLWEFFDKAYKNESLTVGQFRKSMNWLFGWIYYLKWLGVESSIIGKVREQWCIPITRGERPTNHKSVEELRDTSLKEAKVMNDMINSLFGLVDSNCSVVELLKSFSELVKKKDDIHEIAEGDIDKVANVIDKKITVKGVKPALNKFLGFLSGSEFNNNANEVDKN